MSVEGAVDTYIFNVFVQQVLVPTLRPGDVVLLDNLSVHHASEIEQAVRTVHGKVCFLPPYSPDFSPVECCWSQLKIALRGAAARTRRRLERALSTALHFIDPAHIRGWFRHCGYRVASK
jgi:transposase